MRGDSIGLRGESGNPAAAAGAAWDPIEPSRTRDVEFARDSVD